MLGTAPFDDPMLGGNGGGFTDGGGVSGAFGSDEAEATPKA